jgi:hypothetical protein
LAFVFNKTLMGGGSMAEVQTGQIPDRIDRADI